MSKAEEAALKAYPFQERSAKTQFGTITFDQHADTRQAFIEGYEQAEKDLALIPEDVGVIFNLVRELQVKYADVRECYEEVLILFNEARNGK